MGLKLDFYSWFSDFEFDVGLMLADIELGVGFDSVPESVDFEIDFVFRFADFGFGLEINLVSSNMYFECLTGLSVHFHEIFLYITILDTV